MLVLCFLFMSVISKSNLSQKTYEKHGNIVRP